MLEAALDGYSATMYVFGLLIINLVLLMARLAAEKHIRIINFFDKI
jgi:hypothetical protein